MKVPINTFMIVTFAAKSASFSPARLLSVDVFGHFLGVQCDGMVKFQKEEEEKTLKAITLFCFPEGVQWVPVTEYHR